MREYYCSVCLQRRSEKLFSTWIGEGKTKARRCNCCQDDKRIKKIIVESEIERKAKPDDKYYKENKSPILVGLAKTLESRSRCVVRDKLADIADAKRIDKEFEL